MQTVRVHRVLALVAITLFSSAGDAGAQTAMFRGGPDHHGVYQSPAPTLHTLAWKYRTGGRVVSSPVVSGDMLYVGSTDNFLYAIDRTSGTLQWKFETQGPVNSSPAFHNGLVYVASIDGNVYAVDAATGRQRWKFATKGERRFSAPGIHGAIPRTEVMPDPFDVFLSSPTIADGTVYIGSGDHHVYALDVATGVLRWSFRTGDVVHTSPAVANGVVYIGSFDSHMYALDARTGDLRWRHATGTDTVMYNQVGIASSAAVADGVVLFGGRDGHFHAVDARTGALRWKHNNNMGWVIASPAVRDGVVYFPTSDGRRFKALDVATGAVRFNVVNKAISFSSPALAGNVVYFGLSDGWLRALDATTGSLQYEFQSDGSKANGARFTDKDGNMTGAGMYPDRTLDGLMIGLRTMMTLGSMLSSPVVVDGVVYIGSTDGHVYALQ